MGALVSVRLDDKLYGDMKTKAEVLHLSQTDYIRKAIEAMNSQTAKMERDAKLKSASLRVRGESMDVNAEFDEIESDPDA